MMNQDNSPREPRGKHVASPQKSGSTLTEQAHEPTPFALQAQTLSDDARELTEEVARMRETAALLAVRTHVLNRRTTIAMGALAALVVFIIIGGWLIYRQNNTSARLEALAKQNRELIQQLQSQQVQQALTAHEFCGLITLFLSSDNPRSRAANPNGPEAYDRAFGQIRSSAKRLSCEIPTSEGGAR